MGCSIVDFDCLIFDARNRFSHLKLGEIIALTKAIVFRSICHFIVLWLIDSGKIRIIFFGDFMDTFSLAFTHFV